MVYAEQARRRRGELGPIFVRVVAPSPDKVIEAITDERNK